MKEANTMATETKNKGLMEQLKDFIDSTEGVCASGDDAKITRHRDLILKIRAMTGSGGRFVLTNGNKADCGVSVGLTKLFDDCVIAAESYGTTTVKPILERKGKGRPASIVVSTDELTI
jgi:hypothetical protein